MEKLEFIKENKENKMVKLIYILNNNPEKEARRKTRRKSRRPFIKSISR